LFATGFPCNRFSPSVSAKLHKMGLDDPTTAALLEHLCKVVAERPAKLLLFENVARFFGTPAFAELKRTALEAGCAWPTSSCARSCTSAVASAGRRRYKLVALVKLNALAVGLAQSRRRTFALFALKPPKYDFKHLVAQLCASEKRWAIPLKQCLVDDTNREQMRKYGISEADRAAHRELGPAQEESLATALGRLKPPVSPEDASKEWIFCDTGKSVKRAGAARGHAPTLTASSARRAVWCTRLGRHLYPVEHGLLQGWQDDQIKARASAHACACARRLLSLGLRAAHLAGSARAPRSHRPAH
jgi:site-specific DNA-cytosine methylase